MMEFPNECSEFIYNRTYSRWLEKEGRRESWDETVKRYTHFLDVSVGNIPQKTMRKIKEYLTDFEVMPSMRLIWSAGGAAYRDHTCIYNCAYANIESTESFAECLYILMSGCGFGFGVSQKYVDKLPSVAEYGSEMLSEYIIPDSKEGWADSVKMLMDSLYRGKDIPFDYSGIRPEGSRLTTMGGRASGPAPLIRVHQFIREVFNQAQGRKLTTLECHDICNQIAECVVSGGVRRSSQISLSDLNDDEMRKAKVWPFPMRRAMSNNSAVFYEKPSAVEFLKEWAELAGSGTGERGIFNLGDARENAPSRRTSHMIDGTNPCGEIMLRDKEFCNLSEVVIRPDDDLDRLLDKVETATWMGVIQSSLTDFKYLRKKWKTNCEVERLLGVSLTGQLDNPSVLDATSLRALKSRALKVAKKASSILGIQEPKAVTCVKPSGTVSQLVNCSSGIHPRYSRYYLRRYRISSTDPLLRMMRDQGVKFYPEVGQSEEEATTFVCEFPVNSPSSSITRSSFNAMKQLEWYKMVQVNWCEHNASMTVYVKDDEWFEVGNWVYKNWKIVNGLSFLPYSGGKYKLAPYEEIDKETYKQFKSNTPKIDYTKLSKFEKDDNTSGAKSYACIGEKCDI